MKALIIDKSCLQEGHATPLVLATIDDIDPQLDKTIIESDVVILDGGKAGCKILKSKHLSDKDTYLAYSEVALYLNTVQDEYDCINRDNKIVN